MKKKKIVFLTLLTQLTLVVSFIFIMHVNSDIFVGKGDANYSLKLSSFDKRDGRCLSTTRNNNEVEFSYVGYESSAGNWGKLTSKGFIRNTSKISGIESILISFETKNVDLSLSYGWYDDELVVKDCILNSSNNIFSFNNEYPSFFEITNNSNVDVVINSISLSYSCLETSVPANRSKLEFTLKGDEYEVSGSSYGIIHFDVPSTYNNLPVTSISKNALRSSIKSFSSGDNVTTIPDSFFIGATSLESVVLGEKVESIGSNAFGGCSNLVDIKLPDNLHSIGEGAFNNCRSLLKIELNGVETIPQNAFNECRSLTKVILHEGTKSLSTNSFYCCNSLVQVTLPNSLETIGDKAFYFCPNLIEIVNHSDLSLSLGSDDNGLIAKYALSIVDDINNSIIESNKEGLLMIKEGGSYSAIGIENFQKAINIPGFISKIKSNSFSYHYFIEKVNIEEGVREIESRAFDSCSSLKSVSFPNSLITIGSWAFDGCKSLLALSLPSNLNLLSMSSFQSCGIKFLYLHSSLTSIQEYVFNNCSIEKVFYSGTVADFSNLSIGTANDGLLSAEIVYNSNNSIQYIETNRYSYFLFNDGTIHFLKANTKDMSYIDFDEEFDNYRVISLADNSFSGLSSLKDANLSTYIESIGRSSFYYCGGLKNITIPEGVEIISSSVFQGCSSLETVNLPSTLTEIGHSSFYGCISLRECSIPDSVNIIGSYAFTNCSSLQNINLPNGITDINSSTFYGCSSIEEINIPATVENIYSNAFSGCKSVKTLVIPDGVKFIGDAAFGCPLVENIKIPDSVNSISGSPFGFSNSAYTHSNNCKYMPSVSNPYKFLVDVENKYDTTVSVNNDCQFICSSAFNYCTNLTDIVIPEGVCFIGAYAFSHCSALKTIQLPRSLSKMESYPFMFSYELTDIIYAGTIDEWGDIEKPNYWQSYSSIQTIHCLDGEIQLN